MRNLLRPRRTIVFRYPAANYVGPKLRLETRRVLIARVRDCVVQPLAPVTLTADPLLRRARYLVIGTDLDKQVERCFYADSMVDLQGGDTGYFVVIEGEIHDHYDDLRAARQFCRVYNRLTHSRAAKVEFAKDDQAPPLSA